MENKTENAYSIKDLLLLLWSHLLIIIVITFCGGFAAFAYTKLMMPLQYSSHITMYVQSYTGISESAADINNITNSKQLVNTYMEVLKDDAVLNAVGDMLLTQYDVNELSRYIKVENTGKVSPSEIKSTLSISSVQDTSAVKIVSTTLNPKLSADICNDLTKVAPKYVEDAVGVGSINTIDQAKVYPSPVAPSALKNTLIGMAIALFIIVFIVFAIDYFDNTIKDPDVISQRYKKAIIGEIQEFGSSKKKKGKKAKHRYESRGLLTEKNVPFNVIESYKTIRANILFTAADSDRKVIAVSSPAPSEGKSTTSANLAIALAQTGSSVLNNEGLSTLIIKKSFLDKSIKKNVISNLDLLTAGPIPPNPSELLASESFKKLLEQFTEMYDYVIIDIPPINVVSDAMVIKDYISGLVLVIRYGQTTNEALTNCMKQIELAQANVLGFVMNDVYHKHGASYYKYKYKKYGYGYSYGYKYGRDPEEEKAEDENAD